MQSATAVLLMTPFGAAWTPQPRGWEQAGRQGRREQGALDCARRAAVLVDLPGLSSTPVDCARRAAVLVDLPGLSSTPVGGERSSERKRFGVQTGKVPSVTSTMDQAAENERRLVERAKAGDRRALGQLLAEHGPRIYRAVLLPRLGNEERARDALSATYERVIERLDRYEWQPCGIYPWLRVVAMRIALDMLRGTRREVLFDSEKLSREVDRAEAAHSSNPSSFDSYEERHDLEIARNRVRDALETINPRYAEAIRLRVLEDRPREDVAKTMGVTTATFDVLLHRSMAALKKALQAEESEHQEP